MYRKLASAVLVASALQAKYAIALGLGEMTMHSALNEPLNAEVRLNNVRDLDASQVLIKMASRKDFAASGIERTIFLGNVRFAVELDGKGSGVVKLTSNKRLNEPFLDFLLEAKWPSGRALRSYTALVDLPVYTQESKEAVNLGKAEVPAAKPEKVAAPAVETVTQEKPQEIIPEVEEQEVTETLVEAEEPAAVEASKQQYGSRTNKTYGQDFSQSSSDTTNDSPLEAEPIDEEYKERYSAYGDDTYVTQANDTLWEIARSVSPSNDFSVQQVMLALQQNNEHAFIRGNINRLKAGVELSIPDSQMIREISTREAISEVAEQNKQWQGAQLDASDNTQQILQAVNDVNEGHLSLSSDGAGSANGVEEAGDRSGGLSSQAIDAMQGELANAERDNEALNGQVSSLNSQVEKLERMLEIKEAQLAQLQSQMSEGAAESEEAKRLEAQIAEEKAAAEQLAAEEQAAQAQQEESSLQEVTEPEQAEANAVAPAEDIIEEPLTDTETIDVVASTADDTANAVDNEPSVVDEADETYAAPSILDEVKRHPEYLGIIALLIIALVVFFLFRRKSKSESQAMADFEDFDFDEDETANVAPVMAAEEVPVAEDAEPEIEPELDVDSIVDLDDELEEAAVAEAVESESTTLQTGDAIGEADIYIAYGRFGQAADLLKGAIASSPNDVALHSKLLEVYVESKDKDGFQEQFVKLQELGDEAAVNQAKELLTSHEGTSDWLSDLPAAAIGAAAVAGVAAVVSESNDDADELDLSDLDVDLDVDLDGSLDEELDLSGLDVGDDLELDMSSDAEEAFDVDATLVRDAVEDDALLSASDDEEFDLDLGDLDLGLDTDVEETPADDLSLDLSEDLELDESFDLNLESADDVTAVESLDDDLSLDLSSIDLDGDLGNDLESDLALDASDKQAEELSLDDELDLGGFDLELESSADNDLAADEDLSLDESFDADATVIGNDDDLNLDDLDFDLPEMNAEPAIADSEQPEELVEVATEATAFVADDSSLSTLDGDDFEFLSDADEIATKLDLAKAYVEMGDIDGAQEILQEVHAEGNDEQKAEAQSMIDGLE